MAASAAAAPPVVLVQEPAPAGTARSSVLTLINSAVGAGVLSFGFAFRCTGWAAGLLLTLFVAAVEASTLYVLSRYAERSGTKTYSALVHKMLGPAASAFMAMILVFYPYGSCAAHLILVGDSFQPLLLQFFAPAWWNCRAAVISTVGCACILPLCFRTRLGALRAVSSMCVYGLMVVVGAVVYRSAQIVGGPDYSWAPVAAFNPSWSFFTALPLIIFAFQCHTNVISVFDELEPQPAFFSTSSSKPSGLLDAAGGAGLAGEQPQPQQQGQQLQQWGQRQPRSDKLAGMSRVICLANLTTSLFYSCVGLAGYLAFPDSARSDIMLNFRQDDPLIQVARGMIGLIQIAAYPVNHFPARAAIRELLHLATGVNCGGPGFVALETLAFFGATLALALACTDLGAIFKLLGGTCGSVLIFMMPGALLVQYAAGKHRQSRQQRWEQEQQGQHLREPLLAAAAEAAAEDGGGGNGGGGAAAAGGLAQPPLYSLWCSKLFWSGVMLLLISVALGLLTIATTIHPLPPP